MMARPCKDGKPSAPCKSPEGRPTKWTDAAIEKEADDFLEWIKLPNSIWYKDFALERGYDPNLFSIWKDKNEKFSGVLKQVRAWQESKLFKMGLSKRSGINLEMVRFGLARQCGWREEQIVEHKGNIEVTVVEYAPIKRERR